MLGILAFAREFFAPVLSQPIVKIRAWVEESGVEFGRISKGSAETLRSRYGLAARVQVVS